MSPVVVVVIAFRYNDPAFRFVGFPPTSPFNGYPIATFLLLWGFDDFAFRGLGKIDVQESDNSVIKMQMLA